MTRGALLLFGKAAYIDSLVRDHNQISLLNTERLVDAHEWVVDKQNENKAKYKRFETAQSLCFVMA